MNTQEHWESYCSEELAILRPVLKRHGYTLDEQQPHLGGERYLMQAVTTTSGKKLILQGTRADGTRVIIKATRDEAGTRELIHEHTCREVLAKINFADSTFHTPECLAHMEDTGFVITITRFIPQTITFLERPLLEQFDFALRAFKGQESAHATTFAHRALIQKTFGMRTGETYLKNFRDFLTHSRESYTDTLLMSRLEETDALLEKNERTIEQYCGFLTHTDFVPHNIRIEGKTIILLDHSSLTFGNKYEGWARFLNFMTLHNQVLERALVAYVAKNRAREELVALRMMRMYRLGEIIWYYIRTLPLSSDNLLTLNTARVTFWSNVLAHLLKDETVPLSLIEAYSKERNSLRSEDEKERQKGLH